METATNKTLAILSHTAVLSSGGAWYIKNRNGELLVDLERLGWEVTLIARVDPGVREFATFRLPNSIRVIPVDATGGKVKVVRGLLAARRTARAADGLIAFMPSLLSAVVALSARVGYVMYAGHAWGMLDGSAGWRLKLENALASRAQAVITSGDALAEWFAQVHGVQPLVAVPQVPSEVAQRIRSRDEELGAVPEVRLLFVGGLMKRKGIEELIQALAAFPEVPCRIVGSASEEGYASTLAELPNVTLEGYADWDRLREHYEWATVLVLPAHSEGLPRVIHEATAFGAALVLTPVGGIPDRLTDGRDAIFVRVADAADLERGLRVLVEDPSLIPQLSASARQAVAPLFSAPSPAHQFDAVLRSGPGSPGRR